MSVNQLLTVAHAVFQHHQGEQDWTESGSAIQPDKKKENKHYGDNKHFQLAKQIDR